ncbi:hypothetical protein HOK51_10160 [Candidatus Woesearchaeota archaeon]|jgi:hypothetical protein|nr:hypothetical protein [Candidatus Woesearchaeota archaeon]MBT6520188.1 hypothetical protein [Candidatus Woesearchaeota archaeon]MBT7367186.1 hypothetical protein [Candidatus Woesearchaeota archaeon]
MSKNSRAQVAGQIFIYILAIIVVSMILLYGYKAIKGTSDNKEQIEFITLKTDLENSFNAIKTDFGSIKRPKLDVPAKFKKVCFIDLDQPITSATTSDICLKGNPAYEPVVCSGWEIGRNNIYLCPECTDSFSVGDIKVKGTASFICIPVVNNRINLQIEGKGNHVEISTYE